MFGVVFCLCLTHFLSKFFIVHVLFKVLWTTMRVVYVPHLFSNGNDFVQFCLHF